MSRYADNTTIYLSKTDSYTELLEILTKWCTASGTKFNIERMEIIPIGTKPHRLRVINTYCINPTDPPCLSWLVPLAAVVLKVSFLIATVGSTCTSPTVVLVGAHIFWWWRANHLAYVGQFWSGRGQPEASFSRLLSWLSTKVDASCVNSWLIFKHLGSHEQRSWEGIIGVGDRESHLLTVRVTRGRTMQVVLADKGEARQSLLEAEVDERCRSWYSN